MLISGKLAYFLILKEKGIYLVYITFHFHVTQEVKVENEWEVVDFKLKYPFISSLF